MDKMRNLISALLGLVILAVLTGCGSLEPVQTPAPQPTATAVSTPTQPPPTPLPWPTETPVPPTATPRAFPIPEGPPYEGEPFTIVFMRDGELWMSEVGGQGEWQLTHEGPDWAAGEFAISPDGQYIAFITWDQTAASPALENQHVKLVRVADGNTQALTSPDDPYQEFNLAWWDARHMTFQVLPKEGSSDIELQPYTVVIVDIETRERTYELSSAAQRQSPDGRYILLGELLTVRPTSEPYWLYDRETGERWALTGEDEETKFLSWSPDSRWILFGLSREGEGPDTLFVVDVETRTRRMLTPADKTVCGVAAWSPDSRAIAYFQCGPYTCGGANCELWLIAPDGSNQRTVPVSVSDFYIERMAWTPDGSQLVFNESLHNPLPETNYNYIWSVRVDGADLRPIAIGHQQEFQVLPQP